MQVSIITPTYNAEKYISDTILSVLHQTYADFEYIIVDDCSKDKTKDILYSLAKKDKRIKIVELEVNSGAAIARNKGIELAKGEYIAFLDSDDTWVDDKLEKHLKYMNDNHISFSFTNYYIQNKKFETLKDIVEINDIIKFNYIPCSTVIFNQFLLGKEYMPNIRGRQDWGLWIKLIKKCEKAFRFDEYLMNYTIRDDSISSKKLRNLKYHWFIYKKLIGMNFIKASIYFVGNILLHLKNSRR